ncbi:conserved hypothetical protein [Rippkaea orientalis PCC 8801]|uniref:Uncharacterized protein n=1 Tax=Rippkaea orientalis (strain PCC 8801 / RF-1) TaxID=41431 RepID=B7K1J5_RIPO1|nr:hypothetical protein [Rippkaea orientalis]ACK67537.1 conserved hypothetical protein [Rippkaea orientalis PCC 8801]
MNKITQNKTSLEPELNNPESEVSIWKRPVFGEKSLVDDLFQKFNKPEISESSILMHNREMIDLRVFAKTAEAIDNEKFGNEEFLIFVKIKCMLRKGLDNYAGLYDSMELFKVAIEAKDSFIALDQTELRYRGSKQQQFYKFVEQLLADHKDNESFRQNVQAQLSDIVAQIKTEEGKEALESYAQNLDKISKHDLGLKLLSLFKAHQLADYSILRVISEIIQGLNKQDLRDFKSLMSLVMVNYQVFEQLRKIIGLSDKQNTPEVYARLLQYTALSNRHSISYLKFEELVKVLRKWFYPYQAIVGIRQEHPAKDYKLPKEFTEPIPGVEVYEKYKKWFTDKKTGITYINFGKS